MLDVFDSDEMTEYEPRRTAFERAGITEYVAVFDGDPLTFHWNRHDGQAFFEAVPDRRGILKSLALPGLWFPVPALTSRNWWSVLSTIEYGVSGKGHHEFMETIRHKKGRTAGESTSPFEEG